MKRSYVLTALAASGCLWATGCGHKNDAAKNEPSNQTSSTPTVQVITVRKGTIEQTLPVTGTLAALRTQQATVIPATSGVLDELPIAYGQMVQKGQIVAHLSTRPLLGQMQQAQATIAQYQVQVQQAQANSIQQQAQTQTGISQAEAAVSGARATLAGAEATLTGNVAALHSAQQNLARIQTLYKDGLVAQKDVEAAQLAVQTAATQVAAQGQAVASQRETIRSQRQSLVAAHAAALQNVVKQKDVQVAQQQVRNARGALATAQAQMALYTIRAPITGIVTNVGASLGQTVDATTKMVTIVNLNTLQLQVAVPADAAHEVHAGQQITFRVDSRPGKVFAATIHVLSNQVDPASNTVQALAIIPNPRHELTDGAFARVQIVTQRHPSALILPKSAVLRDAGGQVNVAVVGADNVAHVKEVKTGLTQGDMVEILSGVRLGERVVTTGSYGLPDGTKVAVAEGKVAQ